MRHPPLLFTVMLSQCWGKCETLAPCRDTHPHCVTLRYIYPVSNRWADFEPRVTWLMTTEHPLNKRRYLSHGPEPEDHCFPRLSWPQCRDFMFKAQHSIHLHFTTITKIVKCKSIWDIYLKHYILLSCQRFIKTETHCCLLIWSLPSFPSCTACIADVLTVTHSALLLTALSPATDWHSPPQHNSQHDQHMGRPGE